MAPRHARRPPPRSHRWTWPGPVVMVLAIGLITGWMYAMIRASHVEGVSATDEWIAGLIAIGTTLAGAVATYIGSHIGRDTRDRPDTPPEDTHDRDHDDPD